MLRVLICGWLILFLLFRESYSQDIRLSQHVLQLPASNPANTLMHNAYFAGSYRNQWPSAAIRSQSYAVSAGLPLAEINSGIGLTAANENLGSGTLITTSIDALFAKKIVINKRLHFIGAMQGGVVQKSLNAENLIFESPESVPSANEIRPDFGLGIKLAYANKFSAGISVVHLLEPSFYASGESTLPKRIGIDLAYDYYIIKKSFTRKPLILKSNLQYYLQSGRSFMAVGLGIDRYPFFAGVLSRSSQTLVPQAAGMSAGVSLRFGKIIYTYDTGIFTPYNYIANFGCHEVTFLIENAYKRKPNRHKAIKCPD